MTIRFNIRIIMHSISHRAREGQRPTVCRSTGPNRDRRSQKMGPTGLGPISVRSWFSLRSGTEERISVFSLLIPDISNLFPQFRISNRHLSPHSWRLFARQEEGEIKPGLLPSTTGARYTIWTLHPFRISVTWAVSERFFHRHSAYFYFSIQKNFEFFIPLSSLAPSLRVSFIFLSGPKVEWGRRESTF